MPLSALLLALTAAFVHALWNLLLARAPDTRAATAVALVVAVVAFAPVTAVVWEAEASVWPYLIASSCLQLTYFALLSAAYTRAELSLVYPLARGSAPVIVLLGGIAFLGAGASAAQVAGVLLVATGVVLVRGSAPRRGVAFALAIGSVIAAYTLVDKRGIRHASPVTYLELTMIAPSLAYALAVVRAKGLGAVRSAVSRQTVVAGLATFGAYALVLAALQRASAASVAAVRETSVVIAALLATPLLGERVGRARIAGACLVAAGVAALAR
ncbi:MAG TPA: EamA family transporter [Gaiellaceae bacterium]|jgi:drug/metabolite transporter (DMT)-like permease